MLGLITKGKSDDAIADALDLKRNTVRNHVARIYSKIGAHSRAEAIIWARDRGHQLGPRPRNNRRLVLEHYAHRCLRIFGDLRACLASPHPDMGPGK